MGCGVTVEQIQIVERIRIFNSACGLLHLNRRSFLLSIVVHSLLLNSATFVGVMNTCPQETATAESGGLAHTPMCV